jgi:hypothetical protein
MRNAFRLTVVLLTGLLAACSSSGAATTLEPDRIATSVAEAKAVAATLTAGAPTVTLAPATPVPPTPIPPTPAPTLASSTAEPTPLPTLVPPTPAPTATVPRPPTPTNTPVPQRADPFVPGGGDPKGLIGKMVLPGYGGSSDQVDLPVFRQQIVFQLIVHDPDFGPQDGAGINTVEMTIFDPSGQVVQTRTEQNAPYCAFGNDQPECPAWKFAEHGNQWPNGSPVCRGQGYQAIMTVNAKNDDNEDALWRFNFDIDGDYPQC